MKMKLAIGAAFAATTMVAAPAMAGTFNIATNLANPALIKGTVAPDGTTTSFTLNGCPGSGVTTACYQGSSDVFQLVAQRDATSLLIHPGPQEANNSALLFTAPIASVYTFTFNLTKAAPQNDGIDLYKAVSGITGLSGLTYVTSIAAGNSYTLSFSQLLQAGQSAGFAITRGGVNQNYYGDSTFVSGTVSYVPEPATWAMMILGMGAAGFAMRRRNAVRTTVRYA